MSAQTVSLQIPQEHPCYEAHFPGAAVVPGALLLFWVDEKIKSLGYKLEEVSTFKFLVPVLPGQTCTLHIQSKDTPIQFPTKLSVQCFCDEVLAFKGVLKVASLAERAVCG